MIVLGLTSLLMVAVGCTNQEDAVNPETNEPAVGQSSVQENATNEEVPSLTEEKAVQLLNGTIDSIKQILHDYTYKEEGGLAYSEEPDYEYLQAMISPYVAETFFDSNMDLLENWFEYLETDARVFPYFDEEVRFDLKQNATNSHIETIWIADELTQVGDALEFELNYANGSWLLADIVWKSVSEVPLTQEEALAVANQAEAGRFTFVQEVLIDGEKCYEFIDSEGSILTVNSVTSYGSYDPVESAENLASTEPKATEIPVEAEETTSEDPTAELIDNFSKPNLSKSSGLNNESYYLQQVSAIEEYLESILYVADGSGMGSYLYSYTGYKLWDNLLNEVWADLKANLDTTSFNAIKSEQINWISEKEAQSEAAGAEGGVYMWPAAFYYGTAHAMTEERCVELINQFIQ